MCPGRARSLGRVAGSIATLNGLRAVVSRDAGGDAVLGVDGLGERGAEVGGVLGRHLAEAKVVEALLGHGQADQAAAVLGHEVDGFRRDLLGGHGQVALVFAVFVVDDHDHAAGADVLQRGLDIAKWGVRGHDGLVEILAGKREPLFAIRYSLPFAFAFRQTANQSCAAYKQVPRLGLKSSLGMTVLGDSYG